MEPLAVAGMAMLGAALATAVAIGIVGGVIAGSLRGNLGLWALLVAGAYVASSLLLGLRKLWLVGLFPLTLVFLVASLTTRQLRTRTGIRPWLATLAGLLSGLGVGFLYRMVILSGSRTLVDPSTAWIAMGAILCLTVLSIRRTRLPR